MNKIFAALSVVAMGSSAFAATPTNNVPYEVLPAGDTSTQVSYETLPSSAPSASATTLEITAGPGFASMHANDSAVGTGGVPGSTTGFNFALGFDIPMSSAISFGTGIGYVQKGFGATGITNDGTGTAANYSASVKLNYLVVPALVKLNFGDSTRFSIGAGPYAAIRVGSSASATINGIDFPMTVSTDGISSTDFGLRGIASLSIPVDGGISFLIGGGYDFGLSNLSSRDGDSVNSRTFLTNVGVGIKI